MAIEHLKEITAFLTFFKKQITDKLVDIKNEVQYFLDSGISDYLNSLRNKYLKTKTFLYRNENIDFYHVYFPVTLKSIKYTIKTDCTVDQLFQDSNYITIIGVAGSGKTMLLKHLFLNSIDTSFKIPIVIELRALNEFQGSLTDFIYQHILNHKLSPSDKILERILEEGQFVFFLDGYDEIFSANKERITRDIESFIDINNKNIFAITSRPGSNIESLARFSNYFVQPLSEKEVDEFIRLQLKDSGDTELAGRIIETITKVENRDYRSYLGSPLLLSMFILTFNSYPQLPRLRSKFYWNVFDTLVTKHDSFTKKGGWQHERKTLLQNEDFENILKWFSYISFFEGMFSFDRQYLFNKLKSIKESLKYNFVIEDLIHDLTTAISIIIIDGLDYKFPHRSLQEYFTSLNIKEQSPEKKQKIYSEKFTLLNIQTYGIQNLWYLCGELDKKDFYQHFIIPHLKRFLSGVDKNESELRVKAFLDITNVAVSPVIINDHLGGISSRHQDFPAQNICEFLDIPYYFSKIFNIKEYFNASFVQKLDKLIEEKIVSKNNLQYTIDFKLNGNKLYPFICSINMDKKIEDYIKIIRDKVKELEDEIKQDEINKSMLLDI